MPARRRPIADQGHKDGGGPIRWPPVPDSSTRRPESASLYTYLLDADDDLAQEFDIRMRIAARQLATVRVITAEVGQCDLEPWFDAVGGGPGLLILDGLIVFETSVGDRTACELTGAGDLLQPVSPRADQLVEQRGAWRALWPTRLGLLDQEFSERVRPWPQIGLALLRRAGRRIADADALRAIACQPRLEVRLTLLMWHLATRWGRVEPSGIRLMLPLTHRLLGQLVAAERPSVSHALARLARSGLVTGSACDLHLHGTLEDHLQALAERPGSLAGRARRARPAEARRIA